MNRLQRFSIPAAAALTAIIFATACGKKSSAPEIIEVPLGLSAPSLSLAGASFADWTITITGCKSGYSTSVTSTAAAPKTAVGLYKFDQGCVAGLEKFKIDGDEYTKQGGGVLNAAAGTEATFISGTKTKSIKVASQLDSPLTASSKAQFSFYEITNGADKPLQDYSQGHNLGIVGVEAPYFEINAANMTGMTDGVPTFNIKFECQNAISTTKCPTPNADAQAMADMTVKVVDDTFSGTPTYANAEGAFATAGVTTTVDATVGTKGGMTASAVGIGPMYQHRNLIVFIRYSTAGGASYRYFNVDIGEPVAP
jgi:hypothetical protein